MKKLLCALISAAMLAGCAPAQVTPPSGTLSSADFEAKWADSGHVRIWLDGTAPTVALPEGMAEDAVTFGNDIVYYEEGHGDDYGDGEPGEAHAAEEAAAHTVIHIHAPGTYVLTGKLSAGQIAVDLGEGAKEDPEAVVTLILDGVDITCTVAPAVIFYNVYECGSTENPTAHVDTSAAGANVILAEGSWNYISGSHVAKIYKPGTEKKLHKYDAAFYSKMSMNLDGEGFLQITADNEGLDSEMHLTVNGGEISIHSGNDGINTNADGISVTTVNGGTLRIDVTGSTGEGDGIDSNGWLVINGGSVFAYGCGFSADAGLDSDMGIEINGGTVMATGNMLDRIRQSGQTFAVFSFLQCQQAGSYTLKNAEGQPVLEIEAPNDFGYLLLSAPELTEGSYSLWSGQVRFEGYPTPGGLSQIGPIEPPEKGRGDFEIPPQPTNPIVTQGTVTPPQGDVPGNMPVPDFSEGFAPGQMPVPPMPQEGGNMPMPLIPGDQTYQGSITPGEPVREFPITHGGNFFSGLRPAE